MALSLSCLSLKLLKINFFIHVLTKAFKMVFKWKDIYRPSEVMLVLIKQQKETERMLQGWDCFKNIWNKCNIRDLQYLCLAAKMTGLFQTEATNSWVSNRQMLYHIMTSKSTNLLRRTQLSWLVIGTKTENEVTYVPTYIFSDCVWMINTQYSLTH